MTPSNRLSANCDKSSGSGGKSSGKNNPNKSGGSNKSNNSNKSQKKLNFNLDLTQII